MYQQVGVADEPNMKYIWGCDLQPEPKRGVNL